MPELLPFRNFHYKIGKNDPDKLKILVAPPYDVISEEEVIKMKKHPDNICHVILPETYDAAGQKLDEMIKNETLVTDPDKCICIYGIDYTRPDTGEKISRYGFVGLLKLVEIFPATEGVIPHEATFRKFTEDRLNIIQKTDGNFSPIFTIYDGNGTADNLFNKYITKKPFIETLDREGFIHKIWEVSNEEDIKRFQKIVKNHEIIIADGHHRFITSLRHSKHGGCNYIMALFIDFNDPGLIIFPNHRLIRKLTVNSIEEIKDVVNEKFEVIENIEDINDFKNKMEQFKGQHVFGVYYLKKYLILRLKDNVRPEDYMKDIKKTTEWKNLNLPILHNILLKECLDVKIEDIEFIKGLEKGIESVDESDDIKALFVVNPATLEEVQKITRLGEIMPQKSTYFYPKPLSGLIIHRHSNKIE
ncbi:MAG: DUF1015 family protein [Candidatus Thorarchaeota archaeon]